MTRVVEIQLPAPADIRPGGYRPWLEEAREKSALFSNLPELQGRYWCLVTYSAALDGIGLLAWVEKALRAGGVIGQLTNIHRWTAQKSDSEEPPINRVAVLLWKEEHDG